MALSARQITLVASTPTPLLVQGSSGTQFKTISGTVQDLLPVSIKNEDSAATVWIGGPDVSATNGQSLNPGQAVVMNVYSNDLPYAFSTGTPKVSVMVGRQ
jgi:hypothetical protein